MGFVLVDEQADAGGKPQRYIGTNWLIRASFSSFVLNVLSYLGGHGQTAGRGRPAARQHGDARNRPIPQAAVAGPHARGKDRGAGPHAASGKCNFTATDELGIYEAQANGKTFQRFAVNLFDPAGKRHPPRDDPAIKIGHVHGRRPDGMGGGPIGKSGRNCFC